MLSVEAIDHVVFNVADVDASAAWYARVLGMTRHDTEQAPGDVRTHVAFGRHKINLRPVDASQQRWFTGTQPSAGSADLCFLTTSPPDAVAAHMTAHGIAIEAGPVVRDGAMGPIRSVYVRDPDGNLIEVASYEDAAEG